MENFNHLEYLCWAYDEDPQEALNAEHWREQD
jgi:hypothetical protein